MNFKDNENALHTIKFVNATNKSIFLTGKAGTGKTTLLRNIVLNTHKKTIIAAPTGIAALNAGGVTLHSLFQLPFGSFLPSNETSFLENQNLQFTPLSQLTKKIKLNTNKRNLLIQTELLIIDEVSMLRADMLDAIDTILRSVRRKRHLPFGGVQVLFIGDMLQLPPVIKENEWNILRQYYKSLYFFDAFVFQQEKPIVIELERIYRQSDRDFVDILNNLRNNKIIQSDIEILNKYYQKSFEKKAEDSIVYITTHNRKADNINSSELQKLKTKEFSYSASIAREFPENLYPIEYDLTLKVGAQIMFVKNDYSGEERYYNGKIGIIDSLGKDEIKVKFPETNNVIEVEKYTWEHKRFELNKTTGLIDEVPLGEFKHFPIKLAWAITVHKSQGLTFKKAIIDVSDAFAPGQIYVALSRLESLDGLVLTEKIQHNIPEQDARLIKFTERKLTSTQLNKEFEDGSRAYINSVIIESFDFAGLEQEFKYHLGTYDKDENRSAKQSYKQVFQKISEKTPPIKEVGTKFQTQLFHLFNKQEKLEKIQERLTAAIDYFEPLLNEIGNELLALIDTIQDETRIKAYDTELQNLESMTFNKIQAIRKCKNLLVAVIENKELIKENIPTDNAALAQREKMLPKGKTKKSTSKKSAKIAKALKEPKKDTKEVTYEMYSDGLTIDEIAKERGLTKSTIENHIAYYIAESMLDVEDFVPKDIVKKVLEVLKANKTRSLGEIKSALPDYIEYGQIRLVMAHLEAFGGL